MKQGKIGDSSTEIDKITEKFKEDIDRTVKQFKSNVAGLARETFDTGTDMFKSYAVELLETTRQYMKDLRTAVGDSGGVIPVPPPDGTTPPTEGEKPHPEHPIETVPPEGTTTPPTTPPTTPQSATKKK